jgi:uncharacterized protein (DUF433 family)
MTLTVVPISHIATDEHGVARVAGSRVRVVDVAMSHRRGLSADQIRDLYPHLTTGQVYAALSYYADHQADLDAAIAHSLDVARAARATGERPGFATEGQGQ